MRLPAKAARLLRLFAQHFRLTAEHLKKAGGKQFHPSEQNIRFMSRQRGEAGHCGRPVDEGQPFFALKDRWSKSGAVQCISRWKTPAFELGMADSDQEICKVSQWDEIAAGTERTFTGNFG
jgi:hypothetical protein